MRRIIGGQLQCTRCHETKPVAAFDTRPSGHPQSWCKRCKNALSTFYKRRSRAAAKAAKPPVDKPVHHGRNGRRQRDAPPPNNSDEINARLRTMWADKQFKLRMLAARNRGRENFVLGIEREG